MARRPASALAPLGGHRWVSFPAFLSTLTGFPGLPKPHDREVHVGLRLKGPESPFLRILPLSYRITLAELTRCCRSLWSSSLPLVPFSFLGSRFPWQECASRGLHLLWALLQVFPSALLPRRPARASLLCLGALRLRFLRKERQLGLQGGLAVHTQH